MDPFSKGHPLEGLMSRVNAPHSPKIRILVEEGDKRVLESFGKL
jgi:hypothetical protein